MRWTAPRARALSQGTSRPPHETRSLELAAAILNTRPAVLNSIPVTLNLRPSPDLQPVILNLIQDPSNSAVTPDLAIADCLA